MTVTEISISHAVLAALCLWIGYKIGYADCLDAFRKAFDKPPQVYKGRR